MNAAGSHPHVEARDLRKEPDGGGDNENPGTPTGIDGSPEPSPGPRGGAPMAEQPSLPLEQGDSAESSPLRVSKTLDGPEGDPSGVSEKPISGSKYVSTGTFDPLNEKLSPWHFRKKKWN